MIADVFETWLNEADVDGKFSLLYNTNLLTNVKQDSTWPVGLVKLFKYNR